MSLSPADWHQRFLQQAAWTRSLRLHLLPRAGLLKAGRVLDVGSGTGALLRELTQAAAGLVCGVDIDEARLSLARRLVPAASGVQADARRLPFANAAFDLSLCHFLLLWLDDPAAAVQEMRRVTCPGGAVLALAEPDYGGRIDYPAELAPLGALQAEALVGQGADPQTGRKLAAIFASAGLVEIESGVLGAQWQAGLSEEDWELEWQVLASDLENVLSSQELQHMKALDRKAWQQGARVLFVPTFYAWGKVPTG